MRFKNKVAVITGGAHGIGKEIAEEFAAEGATVHIIDKTPGNWFVGDISNKETLERFAAKVLEKSGHVDFLINNALPLMKGIDECSWEEFSYALAVGVTAPFYLTKLLAPHFANGASVINISSSRDRMSQPQTESYTAAKGGIAALTHAMAISLAEKAYHPAGLTQPAPLLQGLMPSSSRWDVSGSRKTSPRWCCSCALRKQDSSPARISASTAA